MQRPVNERETGEKSKKSRPAPPPPPPPGPPAPPAANNEEAIFQENYEIFHSSLNDLGISVRMKRAKGYYIM